MWETEQAAHAFMVPGFPEFLTKCFVSLLGVFTACTMKEAHQTDSGGYHNQLELARLAGLGFSYSKQPLYCSFISVYSKIIIIIISI